MLSVNNKYGITLGTWSHVGTGDIQVVMELVTHSYEAGAVIPLPDPLVVYRDLSPKVDVHIVYSMKLSEFKQKFKAV